MTQGDLNEARKRYGEALSLFQRMGEDQSEAVAWHQLGNLAFQIQDWDEAEHCYKESVTIEEHLGHDEGVAQTCNNLAVVSNNAGRPAEAERWYLRAIEIHERLGRQQELAVMLSNLAGLYLSQARLAEAQEYARRALAIKETLDLSAQPWKTYQILAQIAERQGRLDEVRAWRRKEQESFAAFAGSDQDIKEWLPLINAIVAACNGNQEAQEAVAEFLKQNAEGWPTTVAAIQKILEGERDFEILTGNMQSRTGVLVTQRILQALSDDPEPPSPASRPPSTVHGQAQRPSPQPSPKQGEGLTLPQLLELVERAARGDQQLGGQLFNAFQGMAKADDPAMRALGNALLRVLVGDHNPDLSALPDEVASLIRGMLGRLKNT